MSEQAVGELAYASCLRSWAAALPTNEASREVYRKQLCAAADALARLTEGRRIEAWAVEHDDGACYTVLTQEPRPFASSMYVRATLTLHDEPRSGSET
jgi:hypothetical protein